MAQLTIPAAADKLFVGQEVTYGTAATTAYAVHVQGTGLPRLSQTEIARNAASARLFQEFTTVQGLKSKDSGITFGMHWKPASAVLNAAATPTTPYLGTLLGALLGGEYSAAGSTVNGGSATTTSIPVAVGQGSRFRIGTVISIEVSSVRYFRVVTAIATDTLTVWPELPGAPANGAIVLNGYCYFPTQSNSKSLTIESTHTIPSSSGAETVQRRLRGCTGGFSLDMPQDGLAAFSLDLRGADWDYGALSLDVAAGSETMGSELPVTSMQIYLQPAATTTATHICASSFGATINTGMTHLPCLGGTVQGTAGTARMGGRDMFRFNLEELLDTANVTNWSSQTMLRMLVLLEQGSGASKRCGYLYANRVQIVPRPNPKERGGFLYHDLGIVPVLDTALTVDAPAGAPAVFGMV
jgi:hypothetical protein